MRKAITAAPLDNVAEWFDFSVHGSVAYALGRVFLLGADPSVQMVAALAALSVPLLIRPLGGLLSGVSGDKYGRQRILVITIVTMPINVLCIGLIPSYDTIGIWAPVLLLICKIAQGFLVDGEYIGASIFVAEYSPGRKRGFMGSWLGFGLIAEFMLSAGAMVLISIIVGGANFLGQDWRIPFFIALPLGATRFYLRRTLKETPVFQRHTDKLEQGNREGLWNDPKVSSKGIAAKYWRSPLTCIGLVVTTNVTYHMLLIYIPSYLSYNLHYSEDHRVLVIIIIMIGMLLVQPVMGLLNDRFDRRLFVLLGSVVLFVLTTPAFILINSNVIGLIFAGSLILTVTLNCFTGVMVSALPAMLSTHIRCSTLAAAFDISVSVVGLTLALAAWLIGSSQNLMVSTYYLMVVTVVDLITDVTMKETANHLLKDAILATSDIQETKKILVEHYGSIEQKIDDVDREIADLQAERTRLVQQHPQIDE